MTEEEMKAIAEAATKAASAAVTQATVKMGEDFSALKSENEGLKKIVDDLNAEVKAGKAEVHKMGETLVKATKGFGGVSIVKDLGAGKSELSFSKAKMYRGMATDNWIGADRSALSPKKCAPRPSRLAWALMAVTLCLKSCPPI